jgi:hypothetical protein
MEWLHNKSSHINVYSSCILNSPKWKRSCPSVREWLRQCRDVSFSSKKEWTVDTGSVTQWDPVLKIPSRMAPLRQHSWSDEFYRWRSLLLARGGSGWRW